MARRDSAAGVSKQLRDFIGKQIKIMTPRIVSDLVDANPEDTGHSENNWIPTIGAPVKSPFGSRSAPSDAAQVAGLAKIQSSYKFPAIVYITNTVDYLKALNDGSSAQAPAGFVQTAIAKAVASIV